MRSEFEIQEYIRNMIKTRTQAFIEKDWKTIEYSKGFIKALEWVLGKDLSFGNFKKTAEQKAETES